MDYILFSTGKFNLIYDLNTNGDELVQLLGVDVGLNWRWPILFLSMADVESLGYLFEVAKKQCKAI